MKDQQEPHFHSTAREFLGRYGLEEMRYTVFDKFRFIVTAGLGLIAALAWDESLRAIFKELFPNLNPGLESIIYAIFLTILATIIGVVLGSISKKQKRRKRNQRFGDNN